MSSSAPDIAVDPDRPWFWEGNVQGSACALLEQEGWTILRQADTASKAAGKDIEAVKGDSKLWATVKGYPAGTPRTNPRTQSRHWFSHAIFDVVCYRSANDDVEIAVVLPDFVTYRNLARRIAWFQTVSRFWFIWVSESRVEIQHAPVGVSER